MVRKIRRAWKRRAAALAMAAFTMAYMGNVYAIEATTLPEGGTVTAGSASISTNADTMTITQNATSSGSQNMALNWTSFSIGSAATVNFNQLSASAIALNRVIGNSVSEIYGALNANGIVYLINQNGILFGSNSSVNVGGLVASTKDINISDDAFVNGDS